MPDHPVHPDREELAAWQAGASADPERARTEAHLAGCADCAGAVASQRSTARRAKRLAARTGSGWRRGQDPSASTDGSPAVVGHGPGTGGLLRSALPRP